MKFKNDNDKLLFLSEISEELDIKKSICKKMVENLHINRLSMKSIISRDTYERGSSLVRESLKSKKTRISNTLIKFIENQNDLDRFSKITVLKALSSINTHILIEMEYYQSLYNEIELVNLYKEYSNLYSTVNEQFISNETVKLSQVHIDLIKSII